MFYHEKLVWVLHNHMICKSCEWTVAMIDPHVLSRLPTCAAECFPFAMMVSGIGIHESMMYMFAYLATNKILFGTYTQIIKELHMLLCDKCKVSYLDVASDYSAQMQLFNGGEVPAVFSAFGTPGEFGWIKLSKHLVKPILRHFMEAHKPFIQAHFKSCHDEGVATDHLHKYTKLINALGSSGKIFHALYTVTRLLGKIVSNCLVYASSESEPVVKGIKEVHDNIGVRMQQHETDNVIVDGKLWRDFGGMLDDARTFKPAMSNKLAVATILTESYTYINSIGNVRCWALAKVTSLGQH